MSRQQLRQEARQKPTTIPTIRMPPKAVLKAMRNDYRRERRLYSLISRVWGWDDWIEMSMEAVDVTRI
jgi:hypothetical protein